MKERVKYLDIVSNECINVFEQFDLWHRNEQKLERVIYIWPIRIYVDYPFLCVLELSSWLRSI